MGQSNPRQRSGSVGREVAGVALLGLTLLLLTSLVSFHPLDPVVGQLSGSSGPVHNWMGRIGANLAGVLVASLGLAAFWVPGLLGWWSARLLSRRHQKPALSSAVGLALLVPATAGLICLFWPKVEWAREPLTSGGWVGAILAGMLSEWLKPLGGALVLVILLLTGLMLAVDLSLVALIEAASKSGGSFVSRVATAKIRLKEKKERERSPKFKQLKEKLEQEPPLIKVEDPAVFEPAPEPVQEEFSFMVELGHYQPPPLSLLDDLPPDRARIDSKSLAANSRLVEKKLFDFGVEGRVQEVHGGPVITMYEFEPAPGVKISRIANLADDLALVLRAEAIRIVGPLPGKGTMGIEIPNPKRELVVLKSLLTGSAFSAAKGLLPLVLGKDTVGRSYFTELTRMPHLLIAGATGSGKSVCLNTMLMSVLFRASPQDVRLLIVDPKRIELSAYDGIPHLLHPVLTDPKSATKALRWAVAEMESRYEMLAQAQVRYIESYNQKGAKGQLKNFPGPEGEGLELPDRLPFIIIVIDELADLMMVASREVEDSLTRLAQMARAAGIHLVLATQRPSVDVLTGVIKANFPARIAFQVASKTDSRTILDQNGAENLLGAGDMLFLPPGVGKLTRVHGAFVSEEEVKKVTDYLKSLGRPDYNEAILKAALKDGGSDMAQDEMDELYNDAVQVVIESGKASISMVQRKLRVGYNRAARMIEMMAAEGIVSEPDNTNIRQVLVTS
ncbi:MAG: DNA translocase FtsK 4TM domain-containing protein, partial [Deltaproteobacteria bacterium]|nr:DNA translocase FtsK 4TM domain-containing protein [Deltaproteobacteria bacterium]